MLIKYQVLSSYLTRHPLPAIYILTGQDHFLLTEAAKAIKHTWQSKNIDTEETIIHVSNPSDWALVDERANSYSLFASNSLIDVRFEKQTLDATGKNFFSSYLQNANSSCLILLRAPNLPVKQLQAFTNHNHAHVVQIFPPDEMAMQSWIKEQLQKNARQFSADIPALIYQYTQGNMLACSQAVEKILLVADDASLTTEMVKEQLIEQCNFQLFELSDACLLQNATKVIQHLRHAHHSGTEPTLILWLLAQDIRQLIQLIELTAQAIPFSTACSQLKIWSQRTKLYQSALKRTHKELLLTLLQFCKLTDERIKSTQNSQIWPALESIALSLCLGKQVGTFA
ncbi:DNA polymerase III subunit delta [Legionella cardiaca]|uniref:DNA polymerase III subunit delta n=1 Tax=Legionella cardiaca TaxID=1071983 RepID=A0ABY8ATZ4_9GAMM|nr:DNA polymerase III subunit delta [Legionella cardiaca]WED44160.1 DNA polymerase III subunit delta [Legionella cardiaca]